MNRLYVYIGVAFVAGALAGALVVFPGGPFSVAPVPGVVFVHIENSGANNIRAQVALQDASGTTVTMSSFIVPAHSSVEKTVVNLKQGRYTVQGSFTNNGAQASAMASLDTRACATDSYPLATFTLDSSNGLAMDGPPSTGCRS